MGTDFLRKVAISSLQEPGKAGKTLPKAKNPKIIVFRHSETHDNVRRIFSGRRDTKLTEVGVRQSRELGEKLKKYRIVKGYYPDLERCRRTIVLALKECLGIKMQKEGLLLERDYGQLTGKSKLKAMRDYPEKAVLWRRGYREGPPGGESLEEVEKRVWPFCQRLEKEARETEGIIAVCGSNNSMRIIRRYFEKLTVEQMQSLENPYGDFAAYSV